MNHLYRIVWNAHTACWQAVAETAKGHGKGATCGGATALIGGPTAEPRLKTLLLAVTAALLGLSTAAYAGPEGGQVRAGSASINQSGTTTTINQSSDRAVINWSRFSVGKDESVRFNQPSKTSATLNRVTGAERSDILGSMSANGHVFLINPNGVLVGKGAQVNVGGFIASSLDMDDEDFMSGKINLNGESVAAVTNEGDINAEEGGTVVLIAAEVNNTGTISASQGSVVLAATSSIQQGATTPAPVPAPAPAPVAAPAPAPAPQTVTTESGATAPPVVASAISAAPVAPAQIVSGGGNTADAFTVRLQDGSNIAFTIDKGALNALVNNSGLIKAQGGQVILTAKGRDELSKATVNHSGVIEAQTLTTRNGVVELLADMKVGTVNLSGSINAAAVAPQPSPAPTPVVTSSVSGNPPAATLRGGFVETSAARVNVTDAARVTTAGQIAAGIKTGTWLIDPVDFVIGDNITGAALGAALNATDVTISTVPGNGNFSPSVSATGGRGDIYLNQQVDWRRNTLTLNAERNIYFNQSINGGEAGRLVLQYGQGTTDGAGSNYYFNGLTGARANLSEGNNFATQQGSSGQQTEFTVITRLGVEGDQTSTTLQGLKNNPVGNFALGTDIDATGTISWNQGRGFTPIGQDANSFVGVFDGLGHQVRGIHIDRDEAEVGFFGSATNSTIKNIALVDADIRGTYSNPARWASVGGLVGVLRRGSIIENAGTSGSVSGSGTSIQFVGGLVGWMSPYFYGSGSYCGGCVQINGSYSTASASLTGDGNLGGLVGLTDQAYISNSFATGQVSANPATSPATAGGLVGAWFHSYTISNSFAFGEMSDNAGSQGGLTGSSPGSFPPVSSYRPANSTGVGSPLTASEMRDPSNFVGWDFENTWSMSATQGMPVLRAAPSVVFVPPPPPTPTPSPGGAPGGTVTSPGTGTGTISAPLGDIQVGAFGLPSDSAKATTEITSVEDVYQTVRKPFDDWFEARINWIQLVRGENNLNLPPTIKEMIGLMKSDSGWQEVLDYNQTIYHKNRVGRPESKWINPRTGQEAVYDGDTGVLISEGNFAGTFNFGSNKFSHLIFDILPSPEVWDYYQSKGFRGAIFDAGSVFGANAFINNLNETLIDVYGPGGFDRTFGEGGFYDRLLTNKFSAATRAAKDRMTVGSTVKGVLDQMLDKNNWDMASSRFRIPKAMVLDVLKEVGGNLALDVALNEGLMSKETYDFGVEALKLGFESISDPFIRLGRGEPGVGSAVDFENAFYKTELGKISNPNFKPLNPASNEDTYSLLDKLVENSIAEWNRTGGSQNWFSLKPGVH